MWTTTPPAWRRFAPPGCASRRLVLLRRLRRGRRVLATRRLPLRRPGRVRAPPRGLRPPRGMGRATSALGRGRDSCVIIGTIIIITSAAL
mgnify:CR=1 FL=1